MSDRDEDGQDYDYTKEIQQFKRIWKSYNQEGHQVPAQQEHKFTAKSPKDRGVSGNNGKNKDKIKQGKQKSSKPAQATQKEPPKKIPSKHSPKQSPRGQHNHDQINIQTRVNQNKLKSAQLGISGDHSNELGQTRGRNSARQLSIVGTDGLRREVEQKNQQIALLRVSSNRYHDKIAHLEREIQKRDQLISQLRHQRRNDKRQSNKGLEKEWLIDYGHAEYQSLKKDVKRLLGMLKNTQEYKHFASLGLDDGSVRFLHDANKKQKTNLDVQTNNMHFCTCNKAFIAEPGLWVPENIYKHAKEFVKARKGELTNSQVQLMLYDLNKMWREREKTIINSLNAVKAQQIGLYRRKIQNINQKSQA